MNTEREFLWSPPGVTGWIVCRFLPGLGDPVGLDGRTRIGLLQGSVSVGINLLLFAVKLILGLLLGSVALLADAVHSLSDVGSSLVILLGFWWARKPRDPQHPFGHGRVELVTALVMSVLLIVLAVEFARAGVIRIMTPRPYFTPWWIIVTVGGTMLLKHGLSQFARVLARATRSGALEADYWHHVADVLSTGLVLLALLASRAGWAAIDGWAGLGVAIFILYTGIHTARKAISPLLGEAPSPDEVRRIETAAAAVAGVRGVHDLILHRYGEDRLMSLHVEVDAGLSAMAVHDIAERVEHDVERAIGGKAIVHVDPVDRSHPQYRQAEHVLRSVVSDQDTLSEFHDLRVEGPAHKLALSVDVVAVLGTEEAAYPDIEARVCEAIRHAMGDIATVQVTVETGYHAKAGPES